MTQEQNAKLLQAYRAAIEAGQNEIADTLEGVILAELRSNSPATYEVTLTPAKLSNEAMYELLYGSSNEKMSANMECTGIDEYLPDVSPV